jgi:hypothetical protein
MCENIDQNVGRVLQRLESLGLKDDTIVLYFCDNGPNTARWNGGMKGRKGSVDEGGLRSPLFVRWPLKLPAGRVVKEIAGAIDLLPTLASLAAIKRVGDKPLDGRDLKPLLLGEGEPWSERILFRASERKRERAFPTISAGSTGRALRHDRGSRDKRATSPRSNPRSPPNWALPSLRGGVKCLGTPGAQEGAIPTNAHTRSAIASSRALPFRPGTASRMAALNGARARRTVLTFVNWTRPEDSMTWDIEVATSGKYTVEIQYSCPEADAGSTIRAHVLAPTTLEGKVTPGWDPPLYQNQDTIPRPAAESKMKEFRPLNCGNDATGEGPRATHAESAADSGEKRHGRALGDPHAPAMTL